MATLSEVQGFISVIAPIAQEQAALHRNKIFPSVCIAQACCESAYGTAPKMKNANALFGIKVGSSKKHYGTAWKDKGYSTKTKECYDGKTYVQITDMFRAYDTVSESIEDYYDMLCTSTRYKAAWNQPTPRKCIEGIKNGGYATSPTYVSTIMSIINRYKLDQYDSQNEQPHDGHQIGEHVVMAKVLNIRKNDDASSDDIGDLIKGSVISIDDVKGDWGHFEGWVNRNYLKEI